MKKFKIGDKVKIPLTKQGREENIPYSNVIKRSLQQGYMIITNYNGGTVVCNNMENINGDGDYFHENELELLESNTENYQIY